MFLRLITRSPWRPGFLATIAPEKLVSQEFDASVGASGPHDFAVRNKRFVQRGFSRLTPLRPPHSTPTSVTIMIRPLTGWDGRVLDVIWVNRTPEYFAKPSWTAQIRLNPFDKIALSREHFPEPFVVPIIGQMMRLPNPAPGLKAAATSAS
jgi:hypothetical protein